MEVARELFPSVIKIIWQENGRCFRQLGFGDLGGFRNAAGDNILHVAVVDPWVLSQLEAHPDGRRAVSALAGAPNRVGTTPAELAAKAQHVGVLALLMRAAAVLET